MRFFGALAAINGRLTSYGKNAANEAQQAWQNPMQAAYEAALAASNNGEVLFSAVLDEAEAMGITGADCNNLSCLKIQSLTIDQEGVDRCGGSINISGIEALEVKCDPYTTAARLDTRGLEPPRIGELTCVGYKDHMLAEMPPLEGMSIGRVNCVAADGGAPHNIALSFENCAIGEIQAEDGKHISFTAKDCHIENANFKGAKALAINVEGGCLGGCFDNISIAPSSRGICNVENFSGTMRNAAGYMSLEDTNCTKPEAFAGTDLPRFETAGATLPAQQMPAQQMPAQQAECSNSDRLLEALAQAHGVLGRCGVVQAKSDVEHAADLLQDTGIDCAQHHAINDKCITHEAPSRMA